MSRCIQQKQVRDLHFLLAFRKVHCCISRVKKVHSLGYWALVTFLVAPGNVGHLHFFCIKVHLKYLDFHSLPACLGNLRELAYWASVLSPYQQTIVWANVFMSRKTLFLPFFFFSFFFSYHFSDYPPAVLLTLCTTFWKYLFCFSASWPKSLKTPVCTPLYGKSVRKFPMQQFLQTSNSSSP